MANASGFARDLILTAEQIFNGSNPETKITSPGFLRMLVDLPKPNIISTSMRNTQGHVRDIKLKWRPRSRPGSSQDEYTCDADDIRLYNEAYITASMFKQKAIIFDFEILSKFEDEATALRNAPGIPGRLGGFMNEVWASIAGEMNALIADIDIDLLAKMDLNWGVNATNNVNTGLTINFDNDGTVNDLTQGMTGVIASAQINEVDINNTVIVGSGLINNYHIQNHLRKAIGANQSGLNTSLLGMPQFYNDYYAASAWGANEFGVFDKNAIKFLDLNINQGFRALDMGTSIFFNMPFPITDSEGNTFSMNFDVQVKFIDCPTTIDNGYGDPIPVGPGMVVYIRKSYDLFVEPGGMYSFGDRVFQNNGTLKFTATNS